MISRHQIESRSRQGARFGYIGNEALLAVVLGKYRMILDSADRGIVPHLCLDGFWESWVTAWVANNVGRGWKTANVGANCGYYTMLLADLVGAQGSVHAIEPIHRHVENIRASAQLNGFDQVTVIEAVAGESEGAARLTWAPGRTMNATLLGPGRGHEITIEQVALDDVVEPPLDLLVVDSEGSEPKVYTGMKRLVKDSPGLRMVMEFSPSRYEDPSWFLREMAADGFWFSVLNTEGAEEFATHASLLDGKERMIVARRR